MKIVFIRLLKVLWFLTLIIAPIYIFSALFFIEGGNDGLALAGIFTLMTVIWCSILIIVQYLVFGKLHPAKLFDGTLANKHADN